MNLKLVGDIVCDGKDSHLEISSGEIFGNLEGPILSTKEKYVPSPKAGPHLFSPNLPKHESKFIFSLANNHIMDYGYAGLTSTINTLERGGHLSLGAGPNLFEARKPLIIKIDEIKVGIIVCCEAQFGTANHFQAGVAEIGPWVYSTIDTLKKHTDFIIVSCHAGTELSPWPEPYFQQLYRSYIDIGANIIHGHHSHVPKGFEEYQKGLILYGLGNFLVDPDKWRAIDNTCWSLGVNITFKKSSYEYQFVTYSISKERNIICVKENELNDKIYDDYFSNCNLPLVVPDKLEKIWQEVACLSYTNYGAKYINHPNPPKAKISILNKIKYVLKTFNLIRKKPRDYKYLEWYHMVACESHRQMLTTALGLFSKEITDLRDNESRNLVKK